MLAHKEILTLIPGRIYINHNADNCLYIQYLFMYIYFYLLKGTIDDDGGYSNAAANNDPLSMAAMNASQ